MITSAKCLYDKSNNDIFRPISLEEKHKLLIKLGFNQTELKESTIITSKNSKGEYTDDFKNRNILMVSSTSWTKDEVKKIKLNQCISKIYHSNHHYIINTYYFAFFKCLINL